MEIEVHVRTNQLCKIAQAADLRSPSPPTGLADGFGREGAHLRARRIHPEGTVGPRSARVVRAVRRGPPEGSPVEKLGSAGPHGTGVRSSLVVTVP